MLEHESVDDDGVLTRVPLSFAYAARWATAMEYRLVAMGDSRALYAPRGALSHTGYYTPIIEAERTYVKVRTAVSTFSLYFTDSVLDHPVTCEVGMWGESFPEDLFQQLLLTVRDLPYSPQAIAKLIEKSDWLDLNPMYRGLPGVAGRHLSVDQLEAGGAVEKPADWDW